jgi:hypothetical protein
MYSERTREYRRLSRHACLLRLSANVVPVIEGDRALLLQGEHCVDVLRHRGHRALDVFVGIVGA